MDELPVQPDHVGEQPLGEPVLAHHPGREPRALVGELEVPVALDGEQAVALHPGHGLADRRAALVQPLGDPGAQRHDALLDQLVDGAEVHLGGVDQVAHPAILSHRRLGRVGRLAQWSRCVPTTTVMWFRRDLRLADNPALLEAVRRPTACCRCSCSTRRCGGRPGRPAAAYLAASLRALDASLRQRRRRLVVVRGDPVRQVRAGRAGGRRRAGARRRRLRPLRPPARPRGRAGAGRRRHRAGPHRLAVRRRAGPGDQRLAATPYKVFTPFSKAWPEHGWRGPVDAPTGAQLARARRAPSTIPDADAARRARAARGRRGRGPRRWQAFLDDGLADYDDDRDRPDLDATSRMSVHLKWGEIHPRTMLADLAAARRRRRRRYRKELAWREFYADVLFQRPETAREYLRPEFARDGVRRAGRRSSTRGSEGRTGFPIVDAGMRQLRADRLDAQPGADDRGELPGQGPAPRVAARRPALHAAGWSTATWPPTSTAGSGPPGCGTDAAPYFRVFNPTTPGREVRPRRRLRPALGAGARRPDGARPARADGGTRRTLVGYPAPIVDHAEERHEALDALREDQAHDRAVLTRSPRPLQRAGALRQRRLDAGAVAALAELECPDRGRPGRRSR